MRHVLAALVVPSILLATPPEVGAQEGERATVFGRVLDSTTGAPLEGAFVAVGDRDRGVLTDAEGRFSRPGVHHGHHVLRVERLGYSALEMRLETTGDVGPVVVHLPPDPVLLEGIEILSDRFQRRRNAAATVVRAFQREDLLYTGARDALDFLRVRGGLHLASCGSGWSGGRGSRGFRGHRAPLSGPGDPFGGAYGGCAVVRGRVQPVSVYIDEAPALGGLDQLSMYDPQDLYLVEVYGGGRHVRAYTNGFVEYAAQHRLGVVPLFF